MAKVERLRKDILKVLENGPLQTKKLVIELIHCCASEGRNIYGPDEILSTLYELCVEDAIECYKGNGAICYKIIRK